MPLVGDFGVTLVVGDGDDGAPARDLDEVTDTRTGRVYAVSRAGDEYKIKMSGPGDKHVGAIIQVDGGCIQPTLPRPLTNLCIDLDTTYHGPACSTVSKHGPYVPMTSVMLIRMPFPWYKLSYKTSRLCPDVNYYKPDRVSSCAWRLDSVSLLPSSSRENLDEISAHSHFLIVSNDSSHAGVPSIDDFRKSPFTYFKKPYVDPGFWVEPAQGRYKSRVFGCPEQVADGASAAASTDDIGCIRVFFFDVHRSEDPAAAAARRYEAPDSTKVHEGKKW